MSLKLFPAAIVTMTIFFDGRFDFTDDDIVDIRFDGQEEDICFGCYLSVVVRDADGVLVLGYRRLSLFLTGYDHLVWCNKCRTDEPADDSSAHISAADESDCFFYDEDSFG